MKNFIVLALLSLSVLGVSCTTSQKNTVKAEALEVASSGIGSGVTVIASCEDPAEVKAYLKEKFSELEIFKPEQEPFSSETQKKGIGSTICGTLIVTSYAQMEGWLKSQELLRRGKCSLDGINSITQPWLASQCEKIKF